MSETDHATYVGPIDDLRGQRALVRPDHTYHEPDIRKRTLEARFDDKDAVRIITDENGEQVTDTLGFGWHTFPVTHFTLDRM